MPAVRPDSEPGPPAPGRTRTEFHRGAAVMAGGFGLLGWCSGLAFLVFLRFSDGTTMGKGVFLLLLTQLHAALALLISATGIAALLGWRHLERGHKRWVLSGFAFVAVAAAWMGWVFVRL